MQEEEIVLDGKMHQNLMTKNGAGRGEFQCSGHSNPYIYEFPSVLYQRTIRRSVSDNLPLCR